MAKNIVEALTFVRDGKADVTYVGDMSAINYAIRTNGLRNFVFQVKRNFQVQHRFAFPKTNAELTSIVTKAMASISSEESDIIFSRWLGMRIEQGIRVETL